MSNKYIIITCAGDGDLTNKQRHFDIFREHNSLCSTLQRLYKESESLILEKVLFLELIKEAILYVLLADILIGVTSRTITFECATVSAPYLLVALESPHHPALHSDPLPV